MKEVKFILNTKILRNVELISGASYYLRISLIVNVFLFKVNKCYVVHMYKFGDIVSIPTGPSLPPVPPPFLLSFLVSL